MLALAVLSAGLFAYVYVIDPGRPGELEPLGWFGHSDQGSYLLLAKDMADFHLPAKDFTYGLGYPAVAVPFIWLGLNYDPFVVFNGLTFVFVAVATYVVAKRLSGGSEVIGAVAGFGLVFASPLIVYVDEPWNSTMCLLAAAVILLLGTSPRPRWWHPSVMGLMVGAGFAARYIDVVWLAAMAGAAIWLGPREQRVPGALAGAAAALVIIVPVLIAHQQVLGSVFTTPYESHYDPAHVADQDVGAYDITRVPEATFGEFVSPFLLGQRFGGQPFLQGMFWSLLAIPGAVLALRRGARFRLLVAVTVAGAIVATVFYMSFRGSGPGAVQYGGLHYLKMWWPALAILSALALGAIGRWRFGTRSASPPG